MKTWASECCHPQRKSRSAAHGGKIVLNGEILEAGLLLVDDFSMSSIPWFYFPWGFGFCGFLGI